MGTMRRPWIFLTVVACLLLVLAFMALGCGGNADDEDLVGVWTADLLPGNEIEFKSDGTFVARGEGANDVEGKYTARDGKLSILVSDMDYAEDGEYVIVGETMSLKDSSGATATFTRK